MLTSVESNAGFGDGAGVRASRRLCGVTAAFMLGVFGCSGDDAKIIDGDSPSGAAGAPASGVGGSAGGDDAPGGAAGTSSETPPVEASPLYVVSTTVFAADIGKGYLVPIDALTPNTTFDLTNAIEVADNTGAASRPGTPYLYVGSSEEPTITRWELGDDGKLSKGPSVSFANLGLSSASVSSDLFLSDEKAYMPDDDNHQVVIWNPSTMQVIGAIPLETETEGALLPWMWVSVRPDRVLVSVSWEGDFSDDWSVFGDHVSVISIDPATDAIVDRVDDPRCNYLFWGSKTSDGTAYYSPFSYYTPIRSMLGGDLGPASCALRIPAGGNAFEDGYQIDLGALVGGRPAGNLFFVSDDVALIRAWHSDIVTPISEDRANWVDVINEAGFMWWRWQVGSTSAVQIPDQEPGASEITGAYRVDGRTFLPRVSADYTSTTLDEVDENGEFHPILSGPGNIWGLSRVR
jgi:hypothetical protein